MKRNHVILLFLLAITVGFSGCTDHDQKSIELVKRGKKKLSMGMNEEALGLFNQAIKHNQDNYEAWHFRGNCYISMGMYHEGIEDFEKTIAMKPEFAPAWYNRGLAWSYLDDRDRACADWIRAEALGYPNISDKTRHCQQ